jgi:hypothetical protein
MSCRLKNTSLQFFYLFLLMPPKIKKKEKKVLLPAHVTKSAAHTVQEQQSLSVNFSCPAQNVLILLPRPVQVVVCCHATHCLS